MTYKEKQIKTIEKGFSSDHNKFYVKNSLNQTNVTIFELNPLSSCENLLAIKKNGSKGRSQYILCKSISLNQMNIIRDNNL